MNMIQLNCAEVEKVWRGARSSGDMVAGRGALVIRATSPGAEYPHTTVEIVGTPAELTALRETLDAALTAKEW